MTSAKKVIKKGLLPFYSAYHNRRYDKRYHLWLKEYGYHCPAQKIDEFQQKPLISLLVPTYNTDEKFFYEMISSVFAQIYENWELVFVDDCSTDTKVRKQISEYAAKDSRIKYKFLPKNIGIAEATNEAIKLSSGEFVALFDHDDLLYPDALYEVAMALIQGDYDFIYTDEDKIMEGRRLRHQPFCKPDWNYDFLRSVNYVTHLTVIRRKTLDKVGYENGRYNGAQDWELFLRCTRALPDERIHHIPKVLYGWRVHSGSTAKDMSTKPYVFETQKLAVEDDLKTQNLGDAQVIQDKLYPGQWCVKRTVNGDPKVTILVSGRLGQRACNMIEAKSSYRNCRAMLISDDMTADIIKKIDSEYVVFFQEQPLIKNPEWIQEMLGDAQRSDIAFVQARLKSTKDVEKNIETLLAPSESKLINRQSRRNVAKHLYATAQYSLPKVQGGVVMVSTIELKKVLRNDSQMDVPKWSEELHKQGYRNFYNPYIVVLK